IVLDSSLRIPKGAALISGIDAAPLWLACAAPAPGCADELRRLGAEILPLGPSRNGLDLKSLLGLLAERGITRLLVEGGPHVLQGFLDADLADRIDVFHGAAAAGKGGLEPFVTDGLDRIANSGEFIAVAERPLGPDRQTIWLRKDRA
ncbi:MAG: dihydrofolate reductase family protein, partial [Pseudomonadota bacterium]|nr:dihydrofolate reductase family protein [Pseudomonadota bacterium]